MGTCVFFGRWLRASRIAPLPSLWRVASHRRIDLAANEDVEKVPKGSRHAVFGGHLTLPESLIVDCGRS